MDESKITKLLKKESMSIDVNIYFRGNIFQFYTAQSFSEFLDTQESLWKKVDSSIPLWSQITNQFTVQKNRWASFLKSDDEQLSALLQEIKNNTYQQPFFLFNQKAILYINQVYNSNNQWASNLISQFLQPDSINIYRQPFQLIIAFSVVVSLITNVDNSSDETKHLNERTKELIFETKNEFKTLVETCDVKLVDIESRFKSFITNNELEINKITESHVKTFEQIEKTYEEKIRISKPAELWNEKMEQYKVRGYIWSGLSFLNSGLIAFICYLFFRNFPDIFANAESQTINISATIKWLILTGIGLGSFIYLLRLCVKLALSSFHMSRDAEEKCALTSFYLSLINDKKLDPEKENELKNIVMNSLFARVDTGLLKGDTSPTLPTSGLNEIIKLISGK